MDTALLVAMLGREGGRGARREEGGKEVEGRKEESRIVG